MFHDVGFFDAVVNLESLITIFAAGDGFIIFVWPLRGVLFEYSFSTLHSSEKYPGPCNKHVLSAPVVFLLGETNVFFFSFTAHPFLGLLGNADYPTFLFLT